MSIPPNWMELFRDRFVHKCIVYLIRIQEFLHYVQTFINQKFVFRRKLLSVNLYVVSIMYSKLFPVCCFVNYTKQWQ